VAHRRQGAPAAHAHQLVMARQDELIQRLAALDTCAVSDALDALGIDGVVVGITPLGSSTRVVGRAVTVELIAGSAPPGASHLATTAIDASQAGDVIVVAHDGPADVAGWGGNLHLAAGLHGVSGVVIAGAVRDAQEIADVPPSVFCRGVTPRSARGRVFQRSFNEPIRIGNVPVSPGDLVIADASGLAVLSSAAAPEVIAKAEEIAALDHQRADQIRQGAPVAEVMGTAYERQLSDEHAAP
jgi:4-hydroxy-4-methyl-2-oxoglutarate aldolase